ncbi:hypothetical protein BH10ACI4_BH10ACI4_08940 [soil metagenome]
MVSRPVPIDALRIPVYRASLSHYAESTMRYFLLAPVLLSLALPSSSCLRAQDFQTLPTLVGHITRLDARRDLDVNGTKIVFSATTRAGTEKGNIRSPADYSPTLGQIAHVFGKLNRKHHTLAATEVWLIPTVSGDGVTVSGTAIVDLVLPSSPTAKPGTLSFRADGYRISVTPNTTFTSTLPDPTISGVHSNSWVAYHGIRKPDGSVIADSITVGPNLINHREDKLLDKTDYEPGEVDTNAKQGEFSKFVKGMDPKQIPPYKDPVMQARIDRIGASLVPAYQRALPASDLTKIVFRFQLVDKGWTDAITLPSGVILVPYRVVERLQNDSQVATVLADNIACALEKQTFLAAPTYQALSATNVAATVGGLFIPGLGLASAVATGTTASAMQRHALEQSGRVSLTLLSDAGYDIREAPRTWWLLKSMKTKELADIPLPRRATYLYDMLATTWSAPITTP